MIFSIVIPIYNAESTIRRCLESVRQQRFKDYEVIMVDDGSSDGSENVCLAYVNQDERFKYFKCSNQGVSAARNYGINQARGEFIVFLDSDDIYYEEYLESFSILIKNYPKKNHYWCGIQYISDCLEKNGRELRYSSEETIVLSDRSQIMTLHQMMLDASPVNKVYRKQILDEYCIRMNEEISLGEDLIFNFDYLNCSCDTQIVIYNKANYGYYCFSQDSLSHCYRNDLLKIYQILLGTMYQYMIKWKLPEEQRRLFWNIAFYLYDTAMRNTFHVKNQKRFFQKIKSNNEILKSKEFQQILKKSTLSVNKMYQCLFKLKRYEVILVVDRILKLRKR